MTLSSAKRDWRRWARARRQTLPDRSPLVCAGLLDFLRAQHSRVVLAYRALPGEVDLSRLAGEVTLLTTRAHFGPAPFLSVHAWESATELSQFGALEPPLGTPEVQRADIDTVLLPGLVFDEQGGRLGYGGGFYDRLLAGWAVRTVGVTWDALLVPLVPKEAHDCAVQWLASETGVRPARAP